LPADISAAFVANIQEMAATCNWVNFGNHLSDRILTGVKSKIYMEENDGWIHQKVTKASL
jgi:hypothetical protein